MAYYKRFSAYTTHLNDPDFTSPYESSWDSAYGKCEGTPYYTSYMWSRLLGWGELPDSDSTNELWESWGIDPNEWEDSEYGDYSGLPEVYRYPIDMLDVLAFPELSSVAAVYLYEDDQGFVNVYEIRQRDNEHLEFWGI